MKSPPVWAFLACIVLTAPLRAQTSADDLQKLASAIEQQLAKQDVKVPAAADQAEIARRMTTQFRSAVANGDGAEIESELRQLEIWVDSDDLRQQCEDIVTKLQAAREAKDKAALADIEAVLKKAAETVSTAKSPADLDEIIKTLGARHNAVQRSSPALTLAVQETQSALQFVTRWQDYLAQVASGDTSQAAQTLQNLAALDNGVSLIPRSEILARMHVRPPTPQEIAAGDSVAVEKILSQLKTPE